MGVTKELVSSEWASKERKINIGLASVVSDNLAMVANWPIEWEGQEMSGIIPEEN